MEVFANVKYHFPNDVQCIWGQCRDKFNKMKNKYNVEKKNIHIIGVLPLDWPWYEKFDCLFTSIAKIVGIPQGVDQSVRIVHKQYEILDISYEDDSFNFKAQERPTSLEM